MTTQKKHSLIFLFVLLIVVFNFPVLSIFNRPILVGGIPALLLYIFFVWAVVILILYRWVGRQNDDA